MGSLCLVFLAALLLCSWTAQGVGSGREKILSKQKWTQPRAYFASSSPGPETPKSCSTHSRRKRSISDPLPAYPKRQKRNSNGSHREEEGSGMGTGLYFQGEGTLHLRGSRPLPTDSFTVELWVKPEGGQPNPVHIIGLADSCSQSDVGQRGWVIGIEASTSANDARIVTSLHTDRAPSRTTLKAHRRYRLGEWVHVATTYDGHRMKFFLNGAKVAVTHEQRGSLFTGLADDCKQLYLGGTAEPARFYRGAIDEVRLWQEERTHKQLVHGMFRGWNGLDDTTTLVVKDSFLNFDQWKKVGNNPPHLVESQISSADHDLEITPPRCGQTLCDDPAVVSAYAENWQLSSPKQVRLRIVNVVDDEGNNPVVTEQQLETQREALRKAFKPYNITWQWSVEVVRNTSLRTRTLLFDCDPDTVGDTTCNMKCQKLETGYDGGDCDVEWSDCNPGDIGNDVCNSGCNKQYYDWDGGDCCQNWSPNCFDPTSPFRSYMSLDEYKSSLGLSNDGSLNVYFADWSLETLLGIATFPWEKEVFTVQGGTVIKPQNFGLPGHTENLVHELGHNLGLWHVHYGVSEMDCTDPCVETEPSLELGDLCSDTNPTPEHSGCRDPVSSEALCGLAVYRDTPFKNYMSYADDDCTNHFTRQQTARMHCYLDLMFQRWQSVKQPSPIPLAPKPVAAGRESVTIAWVAPMGSGSAGVRPICSSCVEDYSLVQYAVEAETPLKAKSRTDWAPHQATGPPDADPCEASTRAWMPDEYDCTEQSCFIELAFERAVIPSQISLWVVYQDTDDVAEWVSVELLYETGASREIGIFAFYCDMPVTVQVQESNLLRKIRVNISSPLVGLDAVSIQSTPNFQPCKACPPVSYRVFRDPPFQHSDGNTVESLRVNDLEFIDRSVRRGETYTYHIEAALGKKRSEPSPSLVYIHGTSFCGDGVINSDLGEECDDGNVRDGDGCDVGCRNEKFFYCKGEPSLCYHHDGDGVCEDFEARFSIKDCGFYTPSGFVDQWAVRAEASVAFETPQCPVDVVTGLPATDQKCAAEINPVHAWHPCGYVEEEDNFWLKVWFSEPVVATGVVLHLASDGITELSLDSKHVSVQLLDTDGASHRTSDQEVQLNCRASPLLVPVVHDLSQPFFKTEGVLVKFRSAHVAFSAVALRSSRYIDPLTMGQCGLEEVYNTHTGRCMEYHCGRPSCPTFNTNNGVGNCTGNQEADTCTVKCLVGYELSERSMSTVTCVDGKWQTSSKTKTKCVPINCGPPIITHARVNCPDGTTLGKVCKFECKSPARMEGRDHKIRCEADGFWSLPKASCRVKCAGPPVLKNSTLASRECSAEAKEVGTQCKMKCTKGFHVSEQPPRKRILKLTCTATGDWEGPVCERIKCPPLDPVYIGLYSCTHNFFVDSVCTLKCPGPRGPSGRLTCLQSGQWSDDVPRCKFPSGQCMELFNNEELYYECPTRDIGSKCRVTCVAPFHDAVLRQDLTAQESANMKRRRNRDAGPGRLQELVCTGRLHWHPDPSDVLCIPSCNPEFSGDDLCDSQNNHEHCHWDGGDCCPSTVPGGVVRTYPPDCGSQCSCLDPQAIENRQNNRVRRHHRRHHGDDDDIIDDGVSRWYRYTGSRNKWADHRDIIFT